MQRGPNNLEFAEWRSRTKTLDATAASVGMGQRLVQTSHGTAGLWGTSVSGNLMELLGAAGHDGTDARLPQTIGSPTSWC